MADDATTDIPSTNDETPEAAPDAAAPAKKTAKKTTRKRATKKTAAADDAGSGASAAVSGDEQAETAAPAKKTARKRATKKAAVSGPFAPVPGSVPDTAEGDAPAAEDKAPAKKTARKRTTKKAAAATAAEQDTLTTAAGDTADGDSTETATTSGRKVAASAGVLFQAPPEKPAPRKRTSKKAAAPKAATDEDDTTATGQTDDAAGTKPAGRTVKAADDAGQSTVRADGDDDTTENGDNADNAENSDNSDNSDGEGSEGGSRRRRRRRGGRRRRKGSGEDAGDGDASDDQDSDDTTSAEGGKESGASKDSDDSSGSDDDGETGSHRRRRRRRRRGEEGGGSDDDSDATTVTRVRDRRSTSADEVTAIEGSTRLAAKKQRRREGRAAGRRRAPIVSEAEFLARRESVDRVMVVRAQPDRDLTQIAVLEDKVLVEHYVTRHESSSLIGNVYLGRVQNVLPSMEAAFVDIGKGRNAVLYAGEVDWSRLGEGKPRKIEAVLKSGQTVLVQASKDPIGHKGARLTTQISLPGRYVVYMPQGGNGGISRKLPDTERSRLKSVLKDVVPDDAGVIIRTAAEGATEDELTRDVTRLQSYWDDIERKTSGNGGGNAPQLLYSEPDLLIRVVRDLFNEDFTKLVVQGDEAYETVSAYIGHVAPGLAERVERVESDADVFTTYRVNEQIKKALERKVWLPSGGSLVIDRTEAMTVVDVNTGKFTGSGGNLEETVTKNNLEAAQEIVNQLRLRDLGGIVVVDFIDMVLESNRDLVLRRLVECLGRDRTKHQVAEVTSLGLVQMTRKRIGTGLLEAFGETCDHCHGRGVLVHDEPIEQQPQGKDDGGGSRRGGGRKQSDAKSGGESKQDSRRRGNGSGRRNERDERDDKPEKADAPEPTDTPDELPVAASNGHVDEPVAETPADDATTPARNGRAGNRAGRGDGGRNSTRAARGRVMSGPRGSAPADDHGTPDEWLFAADPE